MFTVITTANNEVRIIVFVLIGRRIRTAFQIERWAVANSYEQISGFVSFIRPNENDRERVSMLILVCVLQQFVWSEFSEEYRPTERRETFYPSVVLADRLYELKITDLPTIPYFPVSSHLEWTDFRYYGLRSANAYVLVFDLSNQDTFQVRKYIYSLNVQSSIANSRNSGISLSLLYTVNSRYITT